MPSNQASPLDRSISAATSDFTNVLWASEALFGKILLTMLRDGMAAFLTFPCLVVFETRAPPRCLAITFEGGVPKMTFFPKSS